MHTHTLGRIYLHWKLNQIHICLRFRFRVLEFRVLPSKEQVYRNSPPRIHVTIHVELPNCV